MCRQVQPLIQTEARQALRHFPEQRPHDSGSPINSVRRNFAEIAVHRRRGAFYSGGCSLGPEFLAADAAVCATFAAGR
ncbi:unnamed protein product, partial [Iphiclides podalirius]